MKSHPQAATIYGPMASKRKFKCQAKLIDGDVRITRGPHKGKAGEAIDCLPNSYKVRIGRRAFWISSGDLEFMEEKSSKA